MFSIKALAVWSFAIGSLLAISSPTVAAQSNLAPQALPRAELAVDYTYLRANAAPGQCGCFSLNGGSAELAFHLFRDLSLVADLTGEHAGTTSIPGQSLSLLTYTAGPRLSYPVSFKRTRVTPFVQGLVGAVHGFDAPFPTSATTTAPSANALAVLLGGGVDIALTHHLSLRALQADYGLTHLPNNSSNTQNLLKVSSGITLRIR